MRKIGSGRGTVTAYPRQLESLIRLAEAHARMRWARHALATVEHHCENPLYFRFSGTVEIVDVEEAKR